VLILCPAIIGWYTAGIRLLSYRIFSREPCYLQGWFHLGRIARVSSEEKSSSQRCRAKLTVSLVILEDPGLSPRLASLSSPREPFTWKGEDCPRALPSLPSSRTSISAQARVIRLPAWTAWAELVSRALHSLGRTDGRTYARTRAHVHSWCLVPATHCTRSAILKIGERVPPRIDQGSLRRVHDREASVDRRQSRKVANFSLILRDQR